MFDRYFPALGFWLVFYGFSEMFNGFSMGFRRFLGLLENLGQPRKNPKAFPTPETGRFSHQNTLWGLDCYVDGLPRHLRHVSFDDFAITSSGEILYISKL